MTFDQGVRGAPARLRASSAALADTQQAFDAVASTYDRSNAENPILCAMRDRSRGMFERLVPPPASVLDLGCGPGCDAEYFAHRGYRVTAVDWSPAMVQETRRRLRVAPEPGNARSIEVRQLGIHELDCLAPAKYDAVYSSFGPLNCVPDLKGSARLIAGRLHQGGLLIASVIGRVCPWEMALFASRGQWRRAAVRFARSPVPVPLEDGTIWTQYYTPREFTASFTTFFDRVALRALGVFVPPPYMQEFASRHSSMVSLLQRVEDCSAGWPIVRTVGDHFLIAARRR